MDELRQNNGENKFFLCMFSMYFTIIIIPFVKVWKYFIFYFSLYYFHVIYYFRIIPFENNVYSIINITMFYSSPWYMTNPAMI